MGDLGIVGSDLCMGSILLENTDGETRVRKYQEQQMEGGKGEVSVVELEMTMSFILSSITSSFSTLFLSISFVCVPT